MSRGGAMVWLAEVLLAAILVGVISHYRAALRGERLARQNAEAVADTTRRWLDRDDSLLQVTTRLVEQGKVQNAALQRQVHGLLTTVATLHVRADTVVREDTLPVGQLADTLDARDSAGVWVAARVVPPVWSWQLRREPFTLTVGLSCDHGAARATVTGPRWATIDLPSLHQSADVCNPTPKWELFSLKPPSLVWLGGSVLLGYVLGRR